MQHFGLFRGKRSWACCGTGMGVGRWHGILVLWFPKLGQTTCRKNAQAISEAIFPANRRPFETFLGSASPYGFDTGPGFDAISRTWLKSRLKTRSAWLGFLPLPGYLVPVFFSLVKSSHSSLRPRFLPLGMRMSVWPRIDRKMIRIQESFFTRKRIDFNGLPVA